MDNGENSLVIDLRFSIYLSLILSVSHLGALICVICVSLSPLIKGVLIISILAQGYYLFRTYVLFNHPNSIYRVVLKINAEYDLYTKQGVVIPAILDQHRLMTRSLIIINFKVEGKRFKMPMILFADSAPKDSLRRFRMMLWRA